MVSEENQNRRRYWVILDESPADWFSYYVIYVDNLIDDHEVLCHVAAARTHLKNPNFETCKSDRLTAVNAIQRER